MPPTDSYLLGPFIGNVTASAATIWIQIPNLVKNETRTVFVTLHEGAFDTTASTAGVINATYDALNVGVVRFDGLKPNTVYLQTVLVRAICIFKRCQSTASTIKLISF